MYLKQVRMQGFKSFAEKTKLEFSPGITVFVGPNGSGKSNIVDAIRWVLGEQSIKSLRGSKMEDIIFSGSTSKRAVGMAEVSFLFDNSTRLLPLDFEEVMITRRFFRSGESDFYINKVRCRLKDIHELFMDTGVGREGFSIIGQGKIDQILSLKAEERRDLIEEAAGIVKYRYRKKEAEKKLGETDFSLIRIQDIVGELEEQVEPLKKQAKKARKYNSWKEEKKELEKNILLKDLAEKQADKLVLEEKRNKLSDQALKAESHNRQKEEALEQLKLEEKKEFEAINLAKEEIHRLDKALEQREYESRLKLQKKDNNQENIKRFKDQEEKLEEKRRTLEGNKDKLLLKIEKNKLEEEKISKNLKLFAEKEDFYKKEKEQLEKEIDFLKEEKYKELDRKNSFLSKKRAFEEKLLFNEKQIGLFRKRKEDFSEKLARIEEESISLEGELRKAREAEEKLLEKINLSKEKLEEYKEIRMAREEEFKKQENLFQKLASQKEISLDLEQSKEGYTEGVRYIFQKNIDGIRGTVADLIEVEQKLEKAIETALGRGLQNIVTDNYASAEKAIEILKKEKKGRATFLPMDNIFPRKAKPFNSRKGILGRAVDLIGFPEDYKNIFEFLLARVVIAENLDLALEFFKEEKSFRIITLDGDVLNSSGALTGGEYRHRGSSLLARKRLLDELEERSLLEEEKLKTMSQKLAEILEEEEKEKNTYSNLLQERSKNKGVTRELKFKVENNLEKNKSYAKELTFLEEEIKRISLDSKGLEEELRDLEEKVVLFENNQENSFQRLRALEKAIEEKNKDYSAFLEEYNKMRLEYWSLQEKNKLELERKEELSVELQAAEKEVKILVFESSRLLEENLSLDLEIEGIKKSRIDLQEEIRDKKRIYEEKELALIEKTSLLEKKRQELALLEKAFRELEKGLYDLDAKISKKNLDLEEGLLHLHKKYLLDIANLDFSFLDNFDLSSSKKRLKKLDSNINSLGLVNFTAIDEFEKVNKRLEFLEGQYKDLIDAKEGLKQVILEIDSVMSSKFKETFEKVNQAFSEVFKELFAGGEAFLKFTDEDDLLNTGIDIIAKPPGKKAQSLSLLSGGERAMTAISLLLGILKVKPSPFCVLDEIDSALDEANVERFSSYLRSFSEQTQFLVISHRKGTMKEADSLYGITMQENGVSKFVSVKINDYIEDK